MTTTLIRKKLISYLENADEKKVKAVYTIFEEEINEENSFKLSEEHIKILDSERQKHLSRKSKSYTWEDAKKIIRGQKKK
ncbi:MAG: hypothetical protein JWO92_1610 [Chitinophagaceae bacterium]|nr:hypothetical protein [Chitinophagaceae bacterium]